MMVYVRRFITKQQLKGFMLEFKGLYFNVAQAYLEIFLNGWERAFEVAENVVENENEKIEKGGNLIPRCVTGTVKMINSTLMVEYKITDKWTNGRYRILIEDINNYNVTIVIEIAEDSAILNKLLKITKKED